MATPLPGAPGAGPGQPESKADLLNVEWRFQEWLMGMGGLNPDNVLDYFALSPFWDPECNNAVLKMQTQFNNLGEMKQRLSGMTGTEFALVHERYPTLFIIQKQRRRSPTEVMPLSIYYVLHGNVFMCPDLHTLLSNRVLGSLHHVESAFNEARVMTDFHPSTGYHWKSAADVAAGTSSPSLPPASTVDLLNTAAGPAKVESQDFRVAVDRAIKNVEQRAHIQQFLLQSGAHGSAAGPAATSTVKQEGSGGGSGSNTQSPTGTPASRSAPKTATKRRKKSEEASAAASSMGINTSVGSGASQGRTGSAGGGNQPTTPATPTATPTKRRKKTKNNDPK